MWYIDSISMYFLMAALGRSKKSVNDSSFERTSSVKGSSPAKALQ